jgi:ElaB/YqjD/DUF883 family membrane-anchored ribosome-binding protein
MTIQTTQKVNNKGRFQETLETAGRVASVVADAEVFKKGVENAFEDAMISAQRMTKRGKYAMEDVFDDTTYLIKKNPWQTVGCVLGAGLGVGFFAGWLLTRRSANKRTPA